VQTASQQADVLAALAALPNLEQLTWDDVHCSEQEQLSDSSLLQHLTRLTSLDLLGVTAAALQHLGSLTKLQHLSASDSYDHPQHFAVDDWAKTGCPGLQELKALTSLELSSSIVGWALPASVSQLTALQQLDVPEATPTALNQLQVLTDLTQLRVEQMTGLSPESPPLQLTGLQHLDLETWNENATMPMSFLASCMQLQILKLHNLELTGPGSLVASTMLQHLELVGCTIAAADGAAGPVSWQQVFPGPGRLPHLTYLDLSRVQPALQQADLDRVVECCSSLKVLALDTLQDSFAPALAQLPRLTNLRLYRATDVQCSAMVQLTGLRQLKVAQVWQVSAVGLRQLAGLQQLISLGLGRFTCIELNTLADHLMKDNSPDGLYAIINKVCVWYCVYAWSTLVCVRVRLCWGERGCHPSFVRVRQGRVGARRL